jgi:hypothetical protein
MNEKQELNLLNLPELPRDRRRRRGRRSRRRTVRVTVVVALLVMGIIALLGTGIIAYWPISDRLRGNNSGSPPAPSKSPAMPDRKVGTNVSIPLRREEVPSLHGTSDLRQG